ncbi:hypothetical protein BKA56DRAFT_576067 [Ilyonectria sp. MPI-CAGE-AT-0026]|nr:hypothetical protein BKA56DRAFT_576067 [Ilyonectria sp. MPI-CAGE-AT-0026]
MPPRQSAAEGNGSGTSSTTAKLRRAHRKSRKGCLECKRRHIKCDETRPRCNNCLVSERACSFPPSVGAAPEAAATAQNQQPPVPVRPASALSPAGSPSRSGAVRPPPVLTKQPPIPVRPASTLSPAGSSSSSGAVRPPPPPSEGPWAALSKILEHARPPTLPPIRSFAAPPMAVFTSKHLILLHHAKTGVVFKQEMMDTLLEIAIAWAIEAPYVLDQLLAICAEHYALSSPETAEVYRSTSQELQTRSLTSFNLRTQGQTPEESSTTYLPRFIFASFVSMNMMYQTFSQYRSSYHVFIGRFLDCIHLHQGVRTVVRSGFHTYLGSVALHPFLSQFQAPEDGVSGNECDELIKAIDSSDLSPTTVAACKSAADSLQTTFNMYNNLPKDENNTHAATAFPVLLTTEFIDVLRKHRPEALLVLAYYGVLLHRHRRSWIIGDAGQFVVHLIADHLGSFWQGPMQWPLQALRDDVD